MYVGNVSDNEDSPSPVTAPTIELTSERTFVANISTLASKHRTRADAVYAPCRLSWPSGAASANTATKTRRKTIVNFMMVQVRANNAFERKKKVGWMAWQVPRRVIYIVASGRYSYARVQHMTRGGACLMRGAAHHARRCIHGYVCACAGE